MANTYILISSNVLGSAAASVTFSSIPATYTDLVLRASARSSVAGVFTNLITTFNSDTTQANYTHTYLNAQSSSTYSGRGNETVNDALTGNDATANTFSSFEYYIPSYTASQFKPFSIISNIENNSSTNWAITAVAYQYRSNTAISTFKVAPPGGENFVSGSSFYLYGIKNT